MTETRQEKWAPALEKTQHLIEKIKHFTLQQKQTELILRQYKMQLQELMEQTGNDTCEGQGITVSLTAPALREHFDKKAFKDQHPDFYEKYCSLQETSKYLRVKIDE